MGDEVDVVEVNQQFLLSVSSTLCKVTFGLVALISFVLISWPVAESGSRLSWQHCHAGSPSVP